MIKIYKKKIYTRYINMKGKAFFKSLFYLYLYNFTIDLNEI